MNSGIYKILNTVNGKYYIGSSVDINNRILQHFRALRSNTHINDHLQRSFNKHGELCFRVEILELVDAEILLLIEQKYIDELDAANPDKGYNICKNAGSTLGRKMSQEQIDSMSGFNNTKSKITPELADSIMHRFIYQCDTQANISQELNISKQIVHKLLAGKTYKLLQEEKDKLKNLLKIIRPQTREKMSESAKKRKVSEDTKRKMSLKSKERHEKNPEFLRTLSSGRKMTDEQKKQISERRMGVKHSEETIEKIKNADHSWKNGESNPKAVLTNEQAGQIRKDRNNMTIKEIAIKYDISISTVKRVIYGKSYRD
jgi:group I intron endonuclease